MFHWGHHVSMSRWQGWRAIQALALVPGGAFLMAFLWRSSWVARGARQFTLFDDAMISMTYGRTLAETGEWVWFPGAERVQGFTNPLWTAYMALLHALGAEGSSAALAVSVTGITLIVACGVLTFRLVQLGLGAWRYASLTSFFAGGSVLLLYPLVFWTLRGMEVGLLAFMTLVMGWGIAIPSVSGEERTGHLVLAGIAAAIGIATRLDFAALAVAVAVCGLAWASDGRRRKRTVLVVVAPMAVIILAVLVFQRVYWGDWLPNTYRLKVEGFPIFERLARGAVSLGKALPILTITALGLVATLQAPSGTMPRRLALGLGSIVLVASVYSVWVGGDAWEFSFMLSRYLSVALPAGVVVTFIGLGHFLQNVSYRGPRFLGIPLTMLFVSGLGYGALTNPLEFRLKPALLESMILGFLAVIFLRAFRAGTRAPRRDAALGLVVLIVAAAIVVATGAPPGYVWIRDRGLHVVEDQEVTESALMLASVTGPGAVVATVWAGAPGYYSRRRMVDLLGKSDRKIATEPPAHPLGPGEVGKLYPGHNKWDYEYSIGELRPDVVLELWNADDAVRRRLEDWGYVERCLDHATVYFLAHSPWVHWNDLLPCPETP